MIPIARRTVPFAVVLAILGLGGVSLAGQTTPEQRVDRGYALLADGKVDEGRSELLTAASTLAPSDATPILRLSRLLSGLSPEGAEAVARAAGRAHDGGAGRAVGRLVRDLESVTPEERPALLLFAARLSAEGGDHDRAAELWYRIASDHRGAAEWPESVVKLGERRLETGIGLDEVAELLESLIVSQPSGALTPAARQVLGRVQAATPGDDTAEANARAPRGVGP